MGVEEENAKSFAPQIFAAVVVTFLATHIGINILFSTLIIPPDLLTIFDVDGNVTELNGTQYNSADYLEIDKEEASWIASILLITEAIGCPLAGFFMDKWGRKTTCFISAVCVLVSWIMTALTGSDITILYIARLLSGLGSGLCLSAISYVTETTHNSIRSRLLPLFAVNVALGQMIAIFLGYILTWRWVAAVCAIMSLINLVLIFFVPESPYWYNMQQIDEDTKKRKILKSVQWLYKNKQHQEEALKAIQSSAENADANQQSSVVTELFKAWKPMLLMITIYFLQQASGVIAISSYALQVFKVAGSVEIDPWISLITMGAIRTAMVFVPIFLKIGRRKLLLSSSAGMAVALLFGGLWLQFSGPSAVPIAAILVYFLSTAVGVLTIPGALTGELLPTRVRGIGSGIIHFLKCVMMFSMTKIFFVMLDAFGIFGVYYFFSFVSAVTVVFVYLFIPETLGKSFEDIANFMELLTWSSILKKVTRPWKS